MGQYDYRGTAQSRMYDWLVTREGTGLALCVGIIISNPDLTPDPIEAEDLEYIRDLVRADVDVPTDPLQGIITNRAAQDAVDNAKRPEVEDDPNKPAPATGGVDYYDMVDPQTGKKKGIPQALGPAPPPTRRYLDKDGKWQEGDRPPFQIPTVGEVDQEPAGPAAIRKALGLDELEEEDNA